MPIVSVVIPAYNRADVIGRALDSALAQSLGDIEVLVVDDASTDNTGEVVKSVDDARVRYFRHDENRFAAAARNTAMEAATGDYIAFLDSDDAWHADKLQRQVDCLASLDEQWACVHGGARLFKDGSARPVVSLPDREGDLLKDYIMSAFVIWTPTFMFRRDCLDRIGLMDTSLRRGQDRDFFIRLLQHYKLAALREPVADIYLETNKPLSRIALESRQILLAKHADLLDSLGPLTRRKAYAKQWMLQAEQYAAEGALLSAIGFGAKAALQWPFMPPRRYAAFCYKLLFGRRRSRLS